MTVRPDLTLVNFLDQGGFNPRPARAALSILHVPFDDMTRSFETERAITSAAASGTRVALWGESGAGKTSTIEFSAATGGTQVATIRIPVSEDSETLLDRRAFLAHVARCIANALREFGYLSNEARLNVYRDTSQGGQSVRRRKATSYRLSSNAFPFLDAAAAREVEEEVEAVIKFGGSEFATIINQLLDQYTGRGLTPVLIIDDSDILASGQRVDPHQVVTDFYGGLIKHLLDEIDVGLIASIHDHYRSNDAFSDRFTLFSREIQLPELPDEAAVRAVLDARVAPNGLHAGSSDDLVDDDCLTELFEIYRTERGGIRRLVSAAQKALARAASAGSLSVSASHVRSIAPAA